MTLSLKILFQGGWKAKRDPIETKESIGLYCDIFAEMIVKNNHQVILTSNREYQKAIANKIKETAEQEGKEIKDHLLFLLPERINDLPTIGVVRQINDSRWWIEDRTYAVQYVDAIVAIGGGRGTFDSVEKGWLSNKPIFIPTKINSKASQAWKRKSKGYHYLQEGDSEYSHDLNSTPEEFFEKTFSIINALEEQKFSRKIFIVHGRDLAFKDSLVNVLKNLDFEPIVLQDEPSSSLTVIEKLERDTGQIGFGFVLYTPDDRGNLIGDHPQNRARQNVIFEHGLLIGQLGRNRTCAIVKGKVETPSDINGILHENIEDISKASAKIAKVLEDAGYRIDYSKLSSIEDSTLT